MRIIHKDLKHGEMKIQVENLDDLWHLYNIIETGDMIQAVTFRTVTDQKDDKIRSKKMEKKPMRLCLRVERVEFHEFSNRLRIHGVIEEGPQDIGAYHTFNIDTDESNTLTIIKDNWLPHQLERIEEAIRQRTQPILLFVSLDDEKATVAILRQSGIQNIAEVESHRSGKMYQSECDYNEYYGEILSILRNYKTVDTPLIVVGPGFHKDYFIAYGKSKDPTLFKSYVSHSTGHAGMNGVYEAVKNKVVDQIVKGNRVSVETEWVEKLLEEIKKDDGLAVYGYNEVKDALMKGAVSTLLLSDKLTRMKEGEELLNLARSNHSEFIIINTQHDAGRKFEGIGGVAAILRYKI
ncbi:MAG: mRNA surveillance protein pelota [Candidatus Thermoplasmatota archaeon]